MLTPAFFGLIRHSCVALLYIRACGSYASLITSPYHNILKPASSIDIKQELVKQPPKKLIELCLRLARFKKENKELLSFLLFEAEDEQSFVQTITLEIQEAFETLPRGNLYFTKKALRKILKNIVRYTKYVNNKESEVEMRLKFVKNLKAFDLPYQTNQAISHIYRQQLSKLDALVSLLHVDLQYEYKLQLEDL